MHLYNCCASSDPMYGAMSYTIHHWWHASLPLSIVLCDDSTILLKPRRAPVTRLFSASLLVNSWCCNVPRHHRNVCATWGSETLVGWCNMMVPKRSRMEALVELDVFVTLRVYACENLRKVWQSVRYVIMQRTIYILCKKLWHIQITHIKLALALIHQHN